MMNRLLGRVVFYSASDLSAGGHLQDAEPILRGFNPGLPHTDANEVLELYNIQLYIEAECRLRTWTDNDMNQFKQTVKSFKPFIVAFASRLDESTFAVEYAKVEVDLKPTFWTLFALYKSYERVSEERIKDELQIDDGLIDILLRNKALVAAYDNVLADYMRRSKGCIDLLLSAYLLELDFPDKKPIIPTSLSLADKEQMISAFVESNTPNISLLRIIEQAKDSNELRLSAETKLKAKRKAVSLYSNMMNNVIKMTYSLGIELVNSPDDWCVKLLIGSDNDYKLCYNERIISEYDEERLVTMFADHYEYINDKMELTLPFNYTTDMVLLEHLSGYHSKRDYPVTSAFNFKQQMAVMQMAFHRQYLQRKGKRLEDLIEWYYEDVLKNKYGYPSSKIELAVEGAPIVEKIRTLLPLIDKIHKRYDLYAAKGEVDEELLKYYKGVHHTDTKSILPMKYVYAKDGCSDVFFPIRLLFHQGAMLDKLSSNFEGEHNLFNTIRHTHVQYDMYNEWQREQLDYLLRKELVKKDCQGVLLFGNVARIAALYDLYKDRVISYWNHPDSVRKEIDQMMKDGLVYTEQELYCKPEKDYLNYLLNDKQFTNGPAIRNEYAHGDEPKVEDSVHEAVYNYLLIVLVCSILKIQSELMLKKQIDAMSEGGATKEGNN